MSPSRAPNSSAAHDDASPRVVAAVDLGSNSFHMVIARTDLGKLHILDKMRERVRVAAGLDESNNLSNASIKRATACLERFGERLRTMNPDHVRVVGTNTLRSAKNADEFMGKLRKAIGHPIDVISGKEEARLIYLGVSHDLGEQNQQRLVVDIGGGSTECIIGERFEPQRADSLHMGCVTYSQRYFPSGKLRPTYFKNAELAAAMELRPIKRAYREGWSEAVGASGTINAVAQILRANGWSRDAITLEGLERLKKEMLPFGRSVRLDILGLEEDRREVLPGGLAILLALFKAFRISSMAAAGGALREGVLYDLLGRVEHEDIREQTVRALAARYGVDRDQASRVEKTALSLLDKVDAQWQLESTRAHQFLRWGARLHEIGLAISYSGYHKHGEYLIANSDLPGFSREEQQALATLVRAHRRGFKPELFDGLPPLYERFTRRLAVILRLAVCFNRSRSDESLPEVELSVDNGAVRLGFPGDFLAQHPMTRLELEREAQRYRAFSGRSLEFG